jgi:DHA1 family bicyclomycin/chloramphenicol resistance-like MFS transporter
MVRDLYSGVEMTKFYALLMLVNGVAPIFAPIFGGQLLKLTPWTGVFLVLGLIGLLLLLSVIRGLPETLPLGRRSTGGLRQTLRTFGDLVMDRPFMGYALAQGLVLAAMFAYIAGSPFVLQDIFGVSPQVFSLLFGVNGVGIILASQVAGRLAGRVSERSLLAAGLAMSCGGSILLLAVILLDGGLMFVLLPLFIAISSVGIVTTAAFSLAMQSQGEAAGSASSLLGLMSFVIGGAVAPLVGLGGEGTALPMAIVMACFGTGAVVAFVGLTRK